ncbi:hypothetical protein OBBRIDRAFT_797269 [Obba rivulosa]|uniref:Uncharacterized protein n=1 Tax=Obba rivulosa TaxID=1052685 RepID=A0A8E2DGX2_9APHY|nr:hypothetical protein OBBRIDRAFT_797269 [Obba rivulosa]
MIATCVRLYRRFSRLVDISGSYVAPVLAAMSLLRSILGAMFSIFGIDSYCCPGYHWYVSRYCSRHGEIVVAFRPLGVQISSRQSLLCMS